MPLGFKDSAFVEAPPFAGWFQSTAASTQTSLPHPLSFLSRGGNNRSNTSAFRVGRLCSFSDAKRSLFRSHQNPPRKHKCHRRACSTKGVFAGSARHWITAVFRPLRGALRSNTPFKVGPRSELIHSACNRTENQPRAKPRNALRRARRNHAAACPNLPS